MQNVREDRHKYIGGSDIPIIMGISQFKKRFDLLLEKAQLKDNDFEGNEYTRYGDELEPKIREHINKAIRYSFEEDKIIQDDMRYHADGYDKKENCVLEIKTTSQIKKSLEEYKTYLVQLLYGMSLYDSKFGLLAVYERPKDFNTDFDEDRLTLYAVDFEEFSSLLDDIKREVEKFRVDLKKIMENPFTTEEELQPTEIIELSNKVVELEEQVKSIKEIEGQLKEFKSKLKELMTSHNIKKWETPNGTKITLVADGEDKTVEEIDYKKLEEENKTLVQKYTKEVTKKGRAGYVKITLPK